VTAPATLPARPWLRLFAPSFGLVAILSILWALATPVFASPDENAHAVKAIGQVRGQVFGEVREEGQPPAYDLPEGYRYHPQIVCFAFQPTVPASCGVELGVEYGTDWFGSWVSAYNPVYYYVVGWPTLFLDGSSGVYGMRIVGALLGSLLIALAFVAALSGARRRWLPLGLAFLATPMVLFLNGSVNPQATEFAAGALLLVALLRLVERFDIPQGPGLSRNALWVLVVIGASSLALGRAIGPLWVVLVVAGALTVAGWRSSVAIFRTRASYLPMGVIAVVGVAALAWTAFTGIFASQAAESDAPLVGQGFVAGAWAMLRLTPRFVQEAAGDFGWLDTDLPTMAYAVFFGVLTLLLVLALVAPARRDRIAVAGALGASVLIPVVVQAAQVSRTGIIWQGRYSLVLYLAVVLIAAWALSRSGERIDAISTGVTAIGVSLLGLYGVAAFVIALHRYVVGSEGTVGRMLAAPDWQPPGSWPVLVALFAATMALFSWWLVALARRAASDR